VDRSVGLESSEAVGGVSVVVVHDPLDQAAAGSSGSATASGGQDEREVSDEEFIRVFRLFVER